MFEHVFEPPSGARIRGRAPDRTLGCRGRLDPGPGSRDRNTIDEEFDEESGGELGGDLGGEAAHVTRRIVEPIEVVEGPDGDPAAFRWRGRRYAVTAVLARWVEALPWWVDGASGQAGDRATGPLVHEQRQVWRVEAASRSGTAGVYDLGRRRRPTPGGWGLERVLD